ncbi:MAG TPA: hypothetical protein DEF80_09475 [Pantoea sp.]|nr:hypothetical protein [Pantoea sp.]
MDKIVFKEGVSDDSPDYDLASGRLQICLFQGFQAGPDKGQRFTGKRVFAGLADAVIFLVTLLFIAEDPQLDGCTISTLNGRDTTTGFFCQIPERFDNDEIGRGTGQIAGEF